MGGGFRRVAPTCQGLSLLLAVDEYGQMEGSEIFLGAATTTAVATAK